MSNNYEPFTPDAFKRATGMDASDNEAIYLRWVNTNINYANYQCMQDMVHSLHEIKNILLVKDDEHTPLRVKDRLVQTHG